MTAEDLWTYLHLLMVAFWVGSDMGVMLCARKSTDSRLPLEARLTMLKVALLIELLPRLMWASALPVGVMLSRQLDLLSISDTGIALVWAFTIIWAAISLGGAHWSDKPIGQRLGLINRWIIGSLGTVLVLLGISSYLGYGPFESVWLAAKVGLYGAINLTILGIEIAFLPLGPAFGRLFAEGSKPDIEAVITSKMGNTMFWVYSTYILIIVVAMIGIAQPTAITLAFVAYFLVIAVVASMAFTGLGRLLRAA
jgi:hypothetical protein